MDFVNKAIASVTPSSTEEKPKVETPSKETTTTPAGSGIVAQAKDTAGVGVSKVAGATADLIGATKEYAKLDETQGVGKHVDNVEKVVRGYATPESKKEEEGGGGVGGALKSAGGIFGK